MKRLLAKSPVLACVLLLGLAAGCSTNTRSVMVHKPDDARASLAVTQLWAGEIRNVARDGDWLLSRSYYAIGDLIALTTQGEDLSHASMYDAKRDMVIEAVGSGVREVTLEKFLDRNHYVIVVRPSNMTVADQHQALDRAKTKLGAKFDIGGMFGVDDPDEFYCSELVYWASQTEARNGRTEMIVTPSGLMKYGEVIYWSGKRDDAQVLQIAADRATEKRTAAR